jgi:hypothetical protein
MEKREALIIVIKSLDGIPNELQEKLINAVPILSDQEVIELGRELAQIKIETINAAKISYDNLSIIAEKLSKS